MKVRQLTVCHTCRSRKLGCDGERPACTQCAASGRDCEGYQYDFIFAKPITPTGYTLKPSKRPAAFQHHPRYRHRNVQSSLTKPSQPLVLCPSMTWALQDIISLVVQNFVPAHETSLQYDTSGFKSRICGSWIEVLPQLSTVGRHGEALTSSIKAFGVAILSVNQNGYVPVADALAAQGSALQLLQLALRHVHQVHVNELSVAIMCLRISELLLPTSRTSSQAHTSGLSRLMQLNGPEFYTAGISHQVFNGARPSMLIQAICARQPTFLAIKEWQVVPYRDNTPSMLQKLMTEALPIPSILAHIDRCRTENTSQSGMYVALAASTVVRKRVRAWYTSFVASVPHVDLFDVIELDGRSRLTFPNLTIANSLTFYWSFWIICTLNIVQLCSGYTEPNGAQPNNGAEKPSTPYLSTADTEEALQMAKKIFQSVDFLLQDDMKLFGANSAALPLRVAYMCVASIGSRDDMAECEVALREVSSNGYQYLVNFTKASDIGNQGHVTSTPVPNPQRALTA